VQNILFFLLTLSMYQKHIMGRGIKRTKIFRNRIDREDFLARLAVFAGMRICLSRIGSKHEGASLPFGVIFSGMNLRKVFLELLEIVCNDLPDKVQINTKILMNDSVT